MCKLGIFYVMKVKLEKYNVAFLVVLFNKEINNSETINSLIKTNQEFNFCKLIIWNNGPLELKSNDVKKLSLMNLDVSIIETVGNISLAKIYNEFIRIINSNKYVLLDHDTAINNKFLEDVFTAEINNLSVPIIKMNGKIQYPKINGTVIKEKQVYDKKSNIISIGSGLVIGKDFILKIVDKKYKTLFDENFYLYGVDSTFFYRINGLKLNGYVSIINGFEHSLSRLEKEKEEITLFRLVERSYDAGLKYRYYYPFYKSVFYVSRAILAYFVRRVCLRKQRIVLKDFINAYTKGKHYRNKSSNV